MVVINKVYTKQGDDGSTGLVGGSRRGKDDLRVESYGELDELLSFVGDALTKTESTFPNVTKMLSVIQNELFDIGAELATPPTEKLEERFIVQFDQVTRLENWIDELNKDLPTLKSFVLPGGSLENAALHICRSVCRRVERSVVRLSRAETVRQEIIIYLNRLSDLLFVMARACGNGEEYLWIPGKSRAS